MRAPQDIVDEVLAKRVAYVGSAIRSVPEHPPPSRCYDCAVE